jgi:hypothetical protein
MALVQRPHRGNQTEALTTAFCQATGRAHRLDRFEDLHESRLRDDASLMQLSALHAPLAFQDGLQRSESFFGQVIRLVVRGILPRNHICVKALRRLRD